MPITRSMASGSHRAPRRLVEGSYLTDGRRLFRVVSQFAAAGDQAFAALEDCRTLQVQAYSPAELYRMTLRPVRIAE